MKDYEDVIEAGGFKVEFVSGPVATVDLITEPMEAVASLATVVRGYKQVYSPTPPTAEETGSLLEDINRTKLHTPLEMLQFVWLVKNVTRAWTHQAVRTRVGAAYVQESMRFSDKRNAQVLVPPAIGESASRLGAYRETVADAFQLYAKMVEDGVPIQDARGVLPHNTLTHIFISYTLSTLAKTASLRYCCQAQAMKADGEGEWKTVLEGMKASLPEELQRFVSAPWEAGEVSCGFEASFDRPCRFQEKFRPNFDRLASRMMEAEWNKTHAKPSGDVTLAVQDVVHRHPADQPAQPSTDGHQLVHALPVSGPVPPDMAKVRSVYVSGDRRMAIGVQGRSLVLRADYSKLVYGAVSLYMNKLREAEQLALKFDYIWVRFDDGERERWLYLPWDEFQGRATFLAQEPGAGPRLVLEPEFFEEFSE